jgi:LysM repeat protein
MRQNFLLCAIAIPLAAGLSSCASTARNIPLGNWEKEAELVAGPTETPDHALPQTEYPFDAEGNYITAWAASGEHRFGTGPSTWAAAKPPKFSASPAAEVAPKSSTRYHKVSASDTLWGLSRKYGTTVTAIQRANGLSDTTIRTGSTIKIPG